MEFLLVGVTIVSLALAVTMSIVAWKLLRGERERSAARVEALEALAFADDPAQPVVSPAMAAAAPADAIRHGTPASPPESEEAVSRPPAALQWDLALGSRIPEPQGLDLEHRRPAASRSIVRTEEMFENTPAPGVAARRWLALAAMVLVVLAGAAIASALRSPEIVAAVAASRGNAPSSGQPPLELLSLRHSTDPEGAFTVTGLVQNPADGRELQKVEAVVYLFDDEGHFFASGKAALDVPTVEPGDESPFVVKVSGPSPVSKYRVGFRQGDGRVVAHIDRRGQLPSGTTGDELAAEAELARPAGGMRPVDGAVAR